MIHHTSHIRKKDMTDFEKCEINVTVVNGHNMKCGIKGSVNMKIQDEKKL